MRLQRGKAHFIQETITSHQKVCARIANGFLMANELAHQCFC